MLERLANARTRSREEVTQKSSERPKRHRRQAKSLTFLNFTTTLLLRQHDPELIMALVSLICFLKLKHCY